MKLSIILLTLVISSCAARGPLPEGYQGPTAFVHDTSEEVSDVKAFIYQVSRVDNRRIDTSLKKTSSENYGKGLSLRVYAIGRYVPANQEIVLKLTAQTYNSAPIVAFGGGNYHINGTAPVTLTEGTEYFVRGELSEEYKAVWVEDADGNVVSEKIVQDDE